MSTFFQRCFNKIRALFHLIMRHVGLPFLFQLERLLRHSPQLHHMFIERFKFNPGVLHYIEKRQEESLIFPHKPRTLVTTSEEARKLYHTITHQESKRANHH